MNVSERFFFGFSLADGAWELQTLGRVASLFFELRLSLVCGGHLTLRLQRISSALAMCRVDGEKWEGKRAVLAEYNFFQEAQVYQAVHFYHLVRHSVEHIVDV